MRSNVPPTGSARRGPGQPVRRRLVGLATAAAMVGGLVGLSAAPAGADGVSSVEFACVVPIVGDNTSALDVSAVDSVDPVAVGGSVTNTVVVPIPAIGEVPIEVTVREVKVTFAIPTGVTVSNVLIGPSSFTGGTWAVTGGNVVVTLTGSIKLGGGSTVVPTAPDLRVVTTVAGPPRTVEWKVPSSVTAKADVPFLGSQSASCTPTNPNQVLITTTVRAPNQAPVASAQSVSTGFQTAKAITLAATDPDGDALTYSVVTGPANGTLSGTAPALTYTPAAGFLGTDTFTFRASDGSLTSDASVAIAVGATAPAAPSAVVANPHAGAAQVSWTPPTNTGGSAITGYRITPVRAGTPQTAIDVPAGETSVLVEGLTDGQAHTFRVAAVNAVGAGAEGVSAAITPQGWLPFASWDGATNSIYQWMLGRAPTNAERDLWRGRYQAGSHTPSDLVVALRSDPLHTGTVDPVVRLYQAYFLRVPDRAGILYWVQQRQSGVSLAKASDGFARSPEFRTLYGTLTNRQFVERIYENILGRPGEPAGITYWTSELDLGRRTRGSVMIGFSESPEYRTSQAANVNTGVLVIYIEGRTPTAAQRTALATRLRGGTATYAQLARESLRSAAVAGRA